MCARFVGGSRPTEEGERSRTLNPSCANRFSTAVRLGCVQTLAPGPFPEDPEFNSDNTPHTPGDPTWARTSADNHATFLHPAFSLSLSRFPRWPFLRRVPITKEGACKLEHRFPRAWCPGRVLGSLGKGAGDWAPFLANCSQVSQGLEGLCHPGATAVESSPSFLRVGHS